MSVYDSGRTFGSRARISGIVEASAECYECNWRCEARNAVGLAAQHTDRTGHVCASQQTLVTTYGPSGTPPERLNSSLRDIARRD